MAELSAIDKGAESLSYHDHANTTKEQEKTDFKDILNKEKNNDDMLTVVMVILQKVLQQFDSIHATVSTESSAAGDCFSSCCKNRAIEVWGQVCAVRDCFKLARSSSALTRSASGTSAL